MFFLMLQINFFRKCVLAKLAMICVSMQLLGYSVWLLGGFIPTPSQNSPKAPITYTSRCLLNTKYQKTNQDELHAKVRLILIMIPAFAITTKTKK